MACNSSTAEVCSQREARNVYQLKNLRGGEESQPLAAMEKSHLLKKTPHSRTDSA